MSEAVDVEVLIVGAGPVGLTLAIDLAWRGIDVTVVETRAAAEPPEPKCNHVAARTMEIRSEEHTLNSSHERRSRMPSSA